MKRLITIMFASACFFVLNAQEKSENIRTITVDDAVILAADNNISLQRQRISQEKLERQNNTAWNSALPSVSLSGGFELPIEKPAPSVMNPNPSDYSYSVSASISLRLTPSLYTSIKDARLKYESGKTSYEEAVRQIELSVRKLFYSLLYTKESINLQKHNMETARLRYENNRDKYNRGQLSELDLLQSQYSYESQRPAIESAEISYQNNLASFKQIMGLSQNEKIELSGSLADSIPPESFSISQSVEDLPSVKKIKASIEQQKNSLLATRLSAYGPTLSASYSYGKAGSNHTKDFSDMSRGHRHRRV